MGINFRLCLDFFFKVRIQMTVYKYPGGMVIQSGTIMEKKPLAIISYQQPPTTTKKPTLYLH